MMTDTTTPVRKTITVDAPRDRAFAVFTEGFDRWWPRSHHIGTAELAESVLEPRAGGRWYERGVDGSECDWGRVLAWDPPARLVLSWEISADWKPDPDRASEVEVVFVAEGPDRTRVELTHRGLEVYGDATAQLRGALDSEGGWTGLLALYATAVTAHAA
jgi:uncharacterized protein YndB with AHSA1/START domain